MSIYEDAKEFVERWDGCEVLDEDDIKFAREVVRLSETLQRIAHVSDVDERERERERAGDRHWRPDYIGLVDTINGIATEAITNERTDT